MKRRYIFFSALLLLSAIIVYVFYPTDKNRIRKVIGNCEEAVVAEDIDKLMKFISYNYRDEYGNGYLKLKKTLQTVFRRLDSIYIERNIKGISVNDKLAEAELSIRVLVSRPGGSPVATENDEKRYIIGDAGNSRTIKVFFEKTSYKWLITKVDGVFDVKN
ncbi:MAG: hypothetical protein V3R54_06965 [Thermodesulfovibrionia bacterium]